MHPTEFINFQPGYAVAVTRPNSHDTLLIELAPESGCILCGGRCCQPAPHSRGRIRQVRDRDILDQRVLLQLPVCRVDCLRCGIVIECIPWQPSTSRLTQRLCTWLEGLLQPMPISYVSRLTGQQIKAVAMFQQLGR